VSKSRHSSRQPAASRISRHEQAANLRENDAWGARGHAGPWESNSPATLQIPVVHTRAPAVAMRNGLARPKQMDAFPPRLPSVKHREKIPEKSAISAAVLAGVSVPKLCLGEMSVSKMPLSCPWFFCLKCPSDFFAFGIGFELWFLKKLWLDSKLMLTPKHSVV